MNKSLVLWISLAAAISLTAILGGCPAIGIEDDPLTSKDADPPVAIASLAGQPVSINSGRIVIGRGLVGVIDGTVTGAYASGVTQVTVFVPEGLAPGVYGLEVRDLATGETIVTATLTVTE
jgi:hypothetical protein